MKYGDLVRVISFPKSGGVKEIDSGILLEIWESDEDSLIRSSKIFSSPDGVMKHYELPPFALILIRSV